MDAEVCFPGRYLFDEDLVVAGSDDEFARWIRRHKFITRTQIRVIYGHFWGNQRARQSPTCGPRAAQEPPGRAIVLRKLKNGTTKGVLP